jgi:hypothetical protein
VRNIRGHSNGAKASTIVNTLIGSGFHLVNVTSKPSYLLLRAYRTDEFGVRQRDFLQSCEDSYLGFITHRHGFSPSGGDVGQIQRLTILARRHAAIMALNMGSRALLCSTWATLLVPTI